MSTTSWGLAVVALSDGDAWATAFLQPGDAAQHSEVAVRLKSAGLKRSSAREWNGGLWPTSRCTVTVQQQLLTELHTGRSRLICSPPLELTPRWQAAAERGRVVVGLAPPGTWPTDTDPGEAERIRLIQTSAHAGELLVGLAQLIDSPEPYGRRW